MGHPDSSLYLCLPVGCLAGVCKEILLGGKDISGTFVECFKFKALNPELSSVDREGQGYAFFRSAEEPGGEGASWGLPPITAGVELCGLDGHCPLSYVITAALDMWDGSSFLQNEMTVAELCTTLHSFQVAFLLDLICIS